MILWQLTEAALYHQSTSNLGFILLNGFTCGEENLAVMSFQLCEKIELKYLRLQIGIHPNTYGVNAKS